MLDWFTDEDTRSGFQKGRAMGHPIQLILARQLAEYLSVPFLLVDPNGTLLFYNEPAESILGQRFEESGAMTPEEWVSTFSRVDDEGQPIPPEDLPLMITLAKHRPAFSRFHLRGLDGVSRHIEAVSIPIVGLQGDFLGAASLFWEISN